MALDVAPAKAGAAALVGAGIAKNAAAPAFAGATEKSAIETAAAIRSGETTALLECEAAIARIEARDGPINAVVVRDFDRARHQARAMDRRLAAGESAPLLGVPMTVKESFDLAGLPTTWGIKAARDFVAQDDALAVKRLKAAGAVILGKTNVPPLLADLQSNNPIYGRTNNPHNHDRVAGGSSGGAAAALAAGMVPLELGSDIGGSIRVPAAFNGVWGHKPTFGALSRDGHFFPGTDGAPGELSVVGPMARNADDLALALDILSDHPLEPADNRPPNGYRVLVLNSHLSATVAAPIADALDRLADALHDLDMTVDRDSDLVPDLAAQQRNYMKMLNITIARGVPQDGSQPTTLVEWFDLRDEQARNQRAWNRLFKRYDAVIAPTLGVTAFAHDDTPLPRRVLDINGEKTPFGVQFAFPGLATFPMLPATSFPIGVDPDGMPIGVQAIADTYQDHKAIAVARLAHGAMQ
ncbi:amidase family protein [Sphingomonas sp.]|uniref:amidase family protein n=1 Tax=Sphingomonas sp. TaxID=28214 RepID=UPI002E332D80|nr:amidase family protein [Sphingomonas sp.]HEX4694751.1 amidase family protein [Sphingomonas sp.]